MVRTSIRSNFVASVAALAASVLVAGSAQAISAVDVVWRGTSSSTVVSPAPSGVITASFILRGDSVGVYAIGFSIQYDTIEGDATALKENAGAASKVGMGNQFTPLVPGGTIDDANGIVIGFESSGPISNTVGCVSCTITLGSVTFHVTAAANGNTDRDVRPGFFNTGVDGAIRGNGTAVPIQFGDAAIVPEPLTAAFGIAALGALGWMASRRR